MQISGAFIKTGIYIQMSIAEKEPRAYTTGLYVIGLDLYACTAYMPKIITLFTRILQTSMTWLQHQIHNVRYKDQDLSLMY